MQVVILAAGVGSRLGQNGRPKALTQLVNGRSILQLQVDRLKEVAPQASITAVVGYQKDRIRETLPNLSYVYNLRYRQENTAGSLRRALECLPDDDLLWLNGDVVFNEGVLSKVIDFGKSCMVANSESVGDEEVKYRTDESGRVIEVSKRVEAAEGEAVGINYFTREDLGHLRVGLSECTDPCYFERAVQVAIDRGTKVYPLLVAGDECQEVDFPEDLVRANQLLQQWSQ